MSKFVSVVIPCYNQAHYVNEAIESVLAQTYRNYEIIVVDDGSTDGTADVVARYPSVRLVRQANKGISGARNAGLWESKGDYLVFLDADDRLLPEALEIGVDMLLANPECGFFVGHVRTIHADGSVWSTPEFRPVEGDYYLSLLQRNDIWSPGQVMYPRAVVVQAGGFNRLAGGAEDYGLNLRISRTHKICSDERLIFEYRVYDSSMSNNYALMLKQTMQVLSRQKRHLNGRPDYETAYKIGRYTAQTYYGERLLDATVDQVRGGLWRSAIHAIYPLVRYYPKGIAKRALRKVTGSRPSLRKF